MSLFGLKYSCNRELLGFSKLWASFKDLLHENQNLLLSTSKAICLLVWSYEWIIWCCELYILKINERSLENHPISNSAKGFSFKLLSNTTDKNSERNQIEFFSVSHLLSSHSPWLKDKYIQNKTCGHILNRIIKVQDFLLETKKDAF